MDYLGLAYPMVISNIGICLLCFILYYKVDFKPRTSNIQKRIYIYERSSALNLLENLPMSFMWTSPAIPELLERYNLVVLDCEDNNNYFQDVLICKKNYTFTEIDNRFLKSLKEMEKEVINELDC